MTSTNPEPITLACLQTAELGGWFDKDSGSAAGHAEIEQEYRTVKFSGTAFASLAQKEAITRLRITDHMIDELIMAKLDSFDTVLRGREPFAGLDDWPADGQLGCSAWRGRWVRSSGSQASKPPPRPATG